MPTKIRATERPAPRKRVSRPGLELIKSFEGFRRRSARLPGGRYVVGHGHIRSARQGVEVSEADAEALLRYDLLPIEAAVNEWAFAPLTQNQFDALVSFAFNIGVQTFRRSDALRHINEGAYLQAAAALEMWRRAELDGEGVIVDALVRRRAAEKALFLKPAAGNIPAPGSVLHPRIDFDAFHAAPRMRVEEVETPLEGEEALALRPARQGGSAPESDYSPAKAAAANVTARLSELIADDEDLADRTDPSLPGLDGLPAAQPDGDFLQAPPSPPETAGPVEAADETFPELDLAPEPLAFAPGIAVASEEELDPAAEDAPIVDLAELPPFPGDAELPLEISPEIQTRFDDQYEPEPELQPGESPDETWGQNSGAQPTQGDPAALSRPVEGPDNGPFIYLFLAGLALVVAAAVTFFRTPEAGVEPAGSGLGWVLGLLGIAGVAGALWAIMGREDATADDEHDA